jgi:prepilin-type N-terminal cleavage/methylation domain-containing protein/prepilin-type processing-associated H-X9-DG protein
LAAPFMRKAGFTLIEILAVVMIIAALLAIAVPTFANGILEGRKSKEISAARKVIAAYVSYAADHDGWLMSGYGGSGDPSYQPAEIVDATGARLDFPANARYPWRLAPYLDYDMHTILFNGNENALKDQVDSHYAASVQPNLGMNVTFVGGDYGSTSDLAPSQRAIDTYGQFCVQRLSQADRPAELIVFASARRTKKDVGFYQVKSPYFTGRRWAADWNPDAAPESFGFVDCRYNGQAVTAMLDGHVEMMGADKLDDMRYWSNQAAESDDPKFTLAKVQVIQR